MDLRKNTWQEDKPTRTALLQVFVKQTGYKGTVVGVGDGATVVGAGVDLGFGAAVVFAVGDAVGADAGDPDGDPVGGPVGDAVALARQTPL